MGKSFNCWKNFNTLKRVEEEVKNHKNQKEKIKKKDKKGIEKNWDTLEWTVEGVKSRKKWDNIRLKKPADYEKEKEHREWKEMSKEEKVRKLEIEKEMKVTPEEKRPREWRRQ